MRAFLNLTKNRLKHGNPKKLTAEMEHAAFRFGCFICFYSCIIPFFKVS